MIKKLNLPCKVPFARLKVFAKVLLLLCTCWASLQQIEKKGLNNHHFRNKLTALLGRVSYNITTAELMTPPITIK